VSHSLSGTPISFVRTLEDTGEEKAPADRLRGDELSISFHRRVDDGHPTRSRRAFILVWVKYGTSNIRSWTCA